MGGEIKNREGGKKKTWGKGDTVPYSIQHTYGTLDLQQPSPVPLAIQGSTVYLCRLIVLCWLNLVNRNGSNTPTKDSEACLSHMKRLLFADSRLFMALRPLNTVNGLFGSKL